MPSDTKSKLSESAPCQPAETSDYLNNLLSENNKHKETMEAIARITLGKGTKDYYGTLRVGVYMIQFIPKHQIKCQNIPKNYFLVPWTMMLKVKERKSDYNNTVIEIVTKDARVLTFCIPKAIRSDAREFLSMFEICSKGMIILL